MAIIRPARGGGPKKKKDDVTKVAAVIDTKKKQIEKKQAIKKGSPKKSSATKKKTPPAKKAFAPPKDLKSETDWIKWLNGVSIEQVSEYLEKTPPASIDITFATVLRTAARRMIKATEAAPVNYNEWLEYFSTMTREETEAFIEAHSHSMSNEAYAAGKRWLQIAENPALIDKIVNSRLESRKAEELGDIVAAAKSRDEVKMFEAIRDNIAYKIQDGSGARDMTVLIKQLREVSTVLAELYRAHGLTDEAQSNIRKILLKARQRSSRPKQQATQTISDFEETDEESV